MTKGVRLSLFSLINLGAGDEGFSITLISDSSFETNINAFPSPAWLNRDAAAAEPPSSIRCTLPKIACPLTDFAV